MTQTLLDPSGLDLGAEVRRLRQALEEERAKQQRLEASLRDAQKLEAVGQLAAGIAHEINTPIQFIGDNLQFLRTSFDDLKVFLARIEEIVRTRADAVTRAAVQVAKEDADVDYVLEQALPAVANSLEGVIRVTGIVQAMKALAHQDRGERSFADLNRALEHILNVSRSEHKYVADIETELGDIPVVSCFLNEMTQVFLNLIVNACHAVGDKVKGTEQRGKIRVSTRLDGSWVEVCIADSGTGIPEHARARIFEPFFTTKEVGRGTGQGLALARAIVVDKHRGTLTFETTLGEGTRFYVRIPVGPPEQAQAPAD